MTWDMEAAKKRCEWLHMGRAAWDSPDSQPVPIGVYNRYREEYRTATFTDLPAAIARCEWQAEMLERAKKLVNILKAEAEWDDDRNQNMPPQVIAQSAAFLRDLEGGPPE